MAYPPEITLRTVTVGGDTTLEDGEPLSVTVHIQASRSLTWGDTGWHYQSVQSSQTFPAGVEAMFELPVTDLAGWRLPVTNSIIDVSTPGSYSHTYTILVVTRSATREVGRRTYANVVVPTGDLSPIDLDTAAPVGTVAGGVVLVPDTWDERVVAAEAAAVSVADALTGEDAAVAMLMGDGGSTTHAATRRVAGDEFGSRLPLPVAHGVTLGAEAPYRPIECFDGWFWGCSTTGQLARSKDGDTWQPMGAPAPTRLTGFIPAGDGELVAIAGQRAYRTTGWTADPATATWAQVAQTSPGTSTFNRHGFDGAGMKFILTEYSSVDRAHSKWVQISLDGGATWTIAWDTSVQFPTSHAESHLHTGCYDPWADRFFFAEGHGTPTGIYWSDDDGATWTRMTGGLAGTLEPTPTVMTATDDGIVCGTDAATWAMYGIARTADPAHMALVGTYRWDDYREGVIGFGMRGWRDEVTGVVYIPFLSADSDGGSGYPIVGAGTATRAAKVWQSPDGGSESRVYQALALDGTFLVMTTTAAAAETKYGRGTVAPVVPVLNRDDAGNIRGGASDARPSSVAAGIGATTGGYWRSVAVGSGAAAGSGTGGEGVSVGYASQAADFGTAVGSNAKSTGAAGTVSIGRNSEASGQQGVAVGYVAKATAAQTTSVGVTATASGAFGTAIGSGATVTSSTSGTAIGANASTSHAHGVAIGRNAATTREYQVAFGPRHLMLSEMAVAPLAPGADNAGLYVVDNGAGKTQLCVRFNTGAAVVLATEP